MADRRPDGDQPSAKRVKTAAEMDPRANPYLAHHYEDQENGGGGRSGNGFGRTNQSALESFKRHNTTSVLAKKAEDGPNNAFNGTELSQRYFSILKTRRNLPVHAQRFVP